MILSRIILPASLPNIMTGLRIGVGRAVIGVVIAEFFTAINGLGAIVIIAGNNFQTAKMFVPIIVLMALGVGLTALVGVLERRVADWHVELAGRS
jgi:NitT/TauT family transport system permease protein